MKPWEFPRHRRGRGPRGNWQTLGWKGRSENLQSLRRLEFAEHTGAQGEKPEACRGSPSSVQQSIERAPMWGHSMTGRDPQERIRGKNALWFLWARNGAQDSWRVRYQIWRAGISLVAQWVKNQPCDAGDMASISGPGRLHMPQGN